MSTAHDGPTTPSDSAPARGAAPTQGAGPLQAAKPPTGPGAISYVGPLLALMVILIGALGLQTAAAATGLTTTRAWLTRAIEGAQGLRPLGWAPLVALVLVLVGLWLLVAGLWPRPKTAVALDAETGVFLRPRDLAQLAHDAADDVDGVAAVHAQASRRKVTLTIHSTGGPEVGQAVQAAVTQRLEALQNDIRVSVKTKQVPL